MRTDSELAALSAEAARVTAEGSKSFYFATKLFPPRLARAAHAVYWFCRYSDDMVDHAPSIDKGRRDLEEWRTALALAWDSGESDHAVLALFVRTAREFEIPREHPFELLEGMDMDLHAVRYETFAELRVFCYRVASVVGLMMSRVIGLADPAKAGDAALRAEELGIAMQLTNILRDVGEDLRMGRIYLPAEDLERFGYSERDLRAAAHNDRFRELMSFQAARARSFYASAMPGIAMLHRDGRFAVRAAADIYRAILSRIEAMDYDVFERRAVVPAWQKYLLTARSIAAPAVGL